MFDLIIGHDAALSGNDEKHLTGLQSSIYLDVLGLDRQNTGFGSHNYQAIIRNDVARWTQTIAVQGRADHPPICKSNRCGTVPWFHEGSMVFIEVPLLLAGVLGPSLWNHHRHRMRQASSRLHQQLKDIVEIR